MLRKFILTVILMTVLLSAVYSQNSETPKRSIFFETALGSMYTSYFTRAESAVDSLENSHSRLPVYFSILGGGRISESVSWTASIDTGMDLYSDSAEYFRLYSFFPAAGLKLKPFSMDLMIGIKAGLFILIPGTSLDYSGSTEFGSGLELNMSYDFSSLKFAKPGIVPGIGIGYMHSELVSGKCGRLSGYITLSLR